MQPVLQTSHGCAQPSSAKRIKLALCSQQIPAAFHWLLGGAEAPTAPAALTKDHFWGTVVPGSHDSGVVLVIEGGTSKVCHADARVPDGFLLTALQANKSSVLSIAG